MALQLTRSAYKCKRFPSYANEILNGIDFWVQRKDIDYFYICH